MTSFSPCVLSIPGLNFLGERQAGHQEKRNEPQQHLSPWKDPERGGRNSSHQPNHLCLLPFPTYPCPPHQPTLLGTWNLWPKDRHHITSKIINHPPFPNPPKSTYPAFIYFFNQLRTFFYDPPSLNGVGGGGGMNAELALVFFKRLFDPMRPPK